MRGNGLKHIGSTYLKHTVHRASPLSSSSPPAPPLSPPSPPAPPSPPKPSSFGERWKMDKNGSVTG